MSSSCMILYTLFGNCFVIRTSEQPHYSTAPILPCVFITFIFVKMKKYSSTLHFYVFPPFLNFIVYDPIKDSTDNVYGTYYIFFFPEYN